MENNINLPATEQRNPKTASIDKLPVEAMLALINDEDITVAHAVRETLPAVAQAVLAAEKALRNGGRCIYVGCGTSGRLGVLDASECPPTFGVEPGLFVGIIAGGETALRNAVEGAEDDPALAVADLQKINITENDFIIGLTASGCTPYVLAALRCTKRIKCKTALITCNTVISQEMESVADIIIAPATGPEVLAGSTRMKAGTAQKMILNMLSTGTMVRMGKVSGNLMTDVKPTNDKLVDRACRIIMEVTGCEYETAKKALQSVDFHVKAAIAIINKS